MVDILNIKKHLLVMFMLSHYCVKWTKFNLLALYFYKITFLSHLLSCYYAKTNYCISNTVAKSYKFLFVYFIFVVGLFHEIMFVWLFSCHIILQSRNFIFLAYPKTIWAFLFHASCLLSHFYETITNVALHEEISHFYLVQWVHKK